MAAYACALALGAAALACIAAMQPFGGRQLDASVQVARWTTRVVVFGLPLLAAVLALRASCAPLRARWSSGVFVVTSIAALVGEQLAAAPESHPRACGGTRIVYAIGPVVFVLLMRSVAAIALTLLPTLLVRDRIVPRWPTITALALVVADVLEHGHYTFTTRNEPWLASQFGPASSTAAWLLALAAAFVISARAASRESITEAASRYPVSAPPIFTSARDRHAVLDPLFLASDLVVALAAVTFVDSMATLAYAMPVRVELPVQMGWPSVLVFGGLIIAFVRLQRASTNGSHAPTVAALAATACAACAAKSESVSLGNAALLVISAGIIGLTVTAPPVADGARLTMRRWAKAIAGAGVAVGVAGVVSLASFACGEHGAARAAKAAALVLAIVAANASTRLSQAARIELAAEDREP